MNSYIEKINGLVLKGNFEIGFSLLRIVIGLHLLFFYLIHFKYRHLLFSENGIFEFSNDYIRSSISLYNFSSSTVYFDTIYIISIVIIFIYLIGYKGYIFSILTYICYASLYFRFVYIGDGGDNLLFIVLFFLIFSNNTKYFSIDSLISSKKETNISEFRLSLQIVISFFVRILCIVQICIVYFTSGIYQVMGEVWNSGTALYYISQVNTFSTPLFKNISINYVYLGVILCYFSILIKIAFPFLIINKKTKVIAVLLICLFHIGIAIFMKLYSFSILMIAIELLLFSDLEYKNMYQSFLNYLNNLKKRKGKRSNQFEKQAMVK